MSSHGIHPRKNGLALKQFGDDIWIAQGPIVRFMGVPFPTRMIVVKLADGSLTFRTRSYGFHQKQAAIASTGTPPLPS